MKLIKIDSSDIKLPKKELPENAKIIYSPMEEELSSKSFMYGILITIILVILGITKKIIIGKQIFIFDGGITDILSITVIPLTMTFIFIPIHEFIHILATPFSSTVYFGVLKEAGGLFIISDGKMSKCRFLIMTILPFSFLLLFLAIPITFFTVDNPIIHNSLFFFTYFSLLCCSGDLYNFQVVWKKVPNGSFIQVSERDTYYFYD